MNNHQHHYNVAIEWTGNNGLGTENYEVYDRSHTIRVAEKPVIEASSDAPFRGDVEKYNPEELFISAISSCHMLWYLHLCADNEIVVHSYEDQADGTLEIDHGNGKISAVTLNPKVTVSESWMLEKAHLLHQEAHKKCFIANSCNCPINILPICTVAEL